MSAPPCPCQSGLPYARCCGPLHAGAPAADALALMRSRYSAYVRGDADYLRASWHASTRPPELALDAGDGVRWLGLEIRRHLAQDATQWLKLLILEKQEDVRLIGPAPCPIERVKTRWRWHLLMRSTHPGAITRLARYFATRFDVPSGAAQLRTALDRDPVALL